MGNSASVNHQSKSGSNVNITEKTKIGTGSASTQTKTKSISPRDFDTDPDHEMSNECYVIISNKLKSLPPIGSRGQTQQRPVYKKIDISFYYAKDKDQKHKHILTISKPDFGSYVLFYDNNAENQIHCPTRQCVLGILSTLNIIDAIEKDHTDPQYAKDYEC